jgi:hypothetical protein
MPIHRFASREDLRDRLARHGIPERMHGGIERYVFDGIMPGSFLSAVLANDLVGAVGAGDHENTSLLFSYAMFLYNEMPSRASGEMWGSREVCRAWCEQRQAELAREREAQS